MGHHKTTADLLASAREASALHAHAGDAATGLLLANRQAPIPLNTSAGRSSDFPLECLGKYGADTANALHDLTQAPKGLCAQSALCAMSTCVSGWGQVEAIGGGSHPMALYFISVAQSGERKSAVDAQAQHGIKVFERQIAAELEKARRDAVEAGCDADEVPESDILITEPTVEGLMRVLARGQGFACLSNDDAAGFFGGHSMSREQRQKTMAILSQLWSGSDIKCPRIHRQDTVLSGVPLTIGLMFQPYLIGQVFGDTEMVEQGILARVLPCYPRSTMGTRFFREPDPNAKAMVDQFARTAFERLEAVREHKSSRPAQIDLFAPAHTILPLSAEARTVLIDLHDDIEGKLIADGEYAAIRAFAGRATENATRLAGVITLFDDPTAGEVVGETAEAAAQLARFYLDEFAYLRNLGKTAKDTSEAAELGTWLARQYGPGGVGHDKEVSQLGPSAFRKAGARKPAIQVLEAHRWIEMLPSGTVVDGSKRQTAFQVHPDIDKVL